MVYNGEYWKKARCAFSKKGKSLRILHQMELRQYEATDQQDIPGAIVFESAPEKNTDYDVIIQKKGERPQWLNKLHSTYMALQFPLLFVYG
ncbi:hypothetical protein CTI12_AA608610 [Artemisia annua]|uniref:Uncharacterized protein n=1 Tax=Artemisia annua TaxID=35608 RepID=A0A2U1KFG3_ARTAN|nr:hypothetical protein CTI12_AA608610 [Artemisia annua]